MLADDVAQEVFIKAYKSLSKFNKKSAFYTWLYKIAVNHSHDIIRKTSRQKIDSWEDLVEKEGDRIERFLSSNKTELSIEDKELVSSILNHLSERYVEVIVLREINGLTYEEIAETLDCTVDSVKAKLRRARKEIDTKVRHVLKMSYV